MMLIAAEAGQIFDVIWVSLLAGVGITGTYSFAVLGVAGSAEARRAGRRGAAFGYVALAGVSLVIFAAGVVFGVHILLNK